MFDDYRERLLSDLESLNIDTKGFSLELKPYSTCYFGRYNPKSKKIIVYLYEDKECTKFMNYGDIFKTVLHEVVHHIQWSDPTYTRLKGVMHNPDFYFKYNALIRKYFIFSVFRKVRSK